MSSLKEELSGTITKAFSPEVAIKFVKLDPKVDVSKLIGDVTEKLGYYYDIMVDNENGVIYLKGVK